jgi:hypothetical protein
LTAAVGGYVLMLLGDWFIGAVVFRGSEDPFVETWHAEIYGSMWSGHPDSPPLLLREPTGFAATASWNAAAAWWRVTGPFIRLFERNLTATGLGYLLLVNLWNIAVWAFFGGAIARIAAFAFTKGEPRGLASSAPEAAARFPAHALAPLLALLAILLVALPLFLAGLLARLHWIAWAAGMLWLVSLVFGFFLAILVVGLVFGWPLLWATIAVEQSDAFDAVSRMYAYVYQRPLHFALYGVVTAVLAVVGSLGIQLFADSTVALSDWAVGWGRGTATLSMAEGEFSQNVSAVLAGAAAGRRFWIQLVAHVAASYPLGLLFSAAVGAYLLLRLHVDAAQTDEITDDELHEPKSLPQLTPHASGIPGVATTSRS